MRAEILDTLEDLSGWMPVASGLAQLTITPERGPHGAVMRLDFDFKGGGGFVVARRPLARRMPEAYVLSFAIALPGLAMVWLMRSKIEALGRLRN